MQLNKSKRVFAIELISVVNVQKKKEPHHKASALHPHHECAEG